MARRRIAKKASKNILGKRKVRKVPRRIPRGKRAQRKDRGGSKYEKRERKEQ